MVSVVRGLGKVPRYSRPPPRKLVYVTSRHLQEPFPVQCYVEEHSNRSGQPGPLVNLYPDSSTLEIAARKNNPQKECRNSKQHCQYG